MIVDCRLANRCVREPLSLASPESPAARGSASTDGLWIAEVDVKCCFHGLRIGEDLGGWFFLPTLMAGHLRVSMASGRLVGSLDLVWSHHRVGRSPCTSPSRATLPSSARLSELSALSRWTLKAVPPNWTEITVASHTSSTLTTSSNRHKRREMGSKR